MNIYLILILTILIGFYLLDSIVEWLNLKALKTDLPEEFVGFYDEEKYRKSQEYLRENTRWNFFDDTTGLILILGFILFAGFNYVDQIARSFSESSIVSGLIFFGILMLLSQIVSLPFSLHRTFVIEEKFGFNRTTWKTYLSDMLKGFLLTIILGAPILALILWFFDSFGEFAWLYAWLGLSAIQILLMFLAPVVIMPLFNKFVPLEDGELKEAIERSAQEQSFHLEGIYKMDGSKRSSKANAYFTGFGKFRRIVLFDTLIEKHSVPELVSILAHEIGHFKHKHIIKMLITSILSTGFMFYFLSLILNNEQLFAAFQMEHVSIYGSLTFMAFLYSPVSKFVSIFSHVMSRKYEYEADYYAARACGSSDHLINGLKRLSVESLSNLTPHKLKVFFEYSHPTVLDRVKALRNIQHS